MPPKRRSHVRASISGLKRHALYPVLHNLHTSLASDYICLDSHTGMITYWAVLLGLTLGLTSGSGVITGDGGGNAIAAGLGLGLGTWTTGLGTTCKGIMMISGYS